MAKAVIKYNPAFLDDEALKANFVVRQADLELLVSAIGENTGDSNQNILVFGPRGIGKTTLILRLALDIRETAELEAQFYPLVFAEESYKVCSAGEFWLEALFHLAEQTKDQRWERAYEELKEERDDKVLYERTLAQLLDFADIQNKRIVVMVENLNMVLGDQVSDKDAWILRHTLQNEPRIMLVGTATSEPDQIMNSGKAMFEMFKLHRLEPLNEAECRALWTSISGKEVEGRRVRALQILTGGSPRLLTIISAFSAHLSFAQLMDDMMQLVDDHTDYFKSHLDNLPAIERKIYVSLLEHWDPATSKQIAGDARRKVGETSSLLKRLMGRGYVETVPRKGRTKWYRVSERLYNIYYLMRRRGASSQRVHALVDFMINFYGPDELLSIASRFAEEAVKLPPDHRADHFSFLASLLQEGRVDSFRSRIQGELSPILSSVTDLPSSLGKAMGIESSMGLDESLLRLYLTEAQRRRLETGTEEWRIFVEAQRLSRSDGCGEAEYIEAERLYRQAIEMAPENALFWMRFATLLAWLSRNERDRSEQCIEACSKVIEIQPASSDAWFIMAGVLGWHLQRYGEAEEAYRRAIALDPKNADPWTGLGLVLATSKRYTEAEEAFREAIDLDAMDARLWDWLGKLLGEALNRPEEALDAHNESIRIERNNFYAWHRVVTLLAGPLDRTRDALGIAEEQIAEFPEIYGIRNTFASAVYENRRIAFLADAERLARDAVRTSDRQGICLHTLASVLCLSGKLEEAIDVAKVYANDVDCVEKTRDDAIDLFTHLAALGAGKEALRVLQDSASAGLLEPLIVALRIYVGEEVQVATEIHEVALDVMERIEEYKKEAEERNVSLAESQ